MLKGGPYLDTYPFSPLAKQKPSRRVLQKPECTNCPAPVVSVGPSVDRQFGVRVTSQFRKHNTILSQPKNKASHCAKRSFVSLLKEGEKPAAQKETRRTPKGKPINQNTEEPKSRRTSPNHKRILHQAMKPTGNHLPPPHSSPVLGPPVESLE